MIGWIKKMFLKYLTEKQEPLFHGAMVQRAFYIPFTVWDRLSAEGNHTLIETLRRVERKEEGYGTIIIPANGFSKDPETNRAVIEWLQEKGVLVYNPQQEIKELSETL